MGHGGLSSITLREAIPADRDTVIAISTITQHEHAARLPDHFLPGGEQDVPAMFDGCFINDRHPDDETFARLIVACKDDCVIGHVLLLFGPATPVQGLRDLRCHINDLSVHPDFRGQGTGTALMARALEVCRQEGATDLQGYVWQGNDGSAQVFTRADFNPAATLFSKRLGPPQRVSAAVDSQTDHAKAQPSTDVLVIMGIIVAILLAARFLF